MKETDPEKLIKLLEFELNSERAKRGKKAALRNAFRIWSIILLLAGTFAAVAALQYLTSTLPRPQHAAVTEKLDTK